MHAQRCRLSWVSLVPNARDDLSSPTSSSRHSIEYWNSKYPIFARVEDILVMLLKYSKGKKREKNPSDRLSLVKHRKKYRKNDLRRFFFFSCMLLWIFIGIIIVLSLCKLIFSLRSPSQFIWKGSFSCSNHSRTVREHFNDPTEKRKNCNGKSFQSNWPFNHHSSSSFT